MTWNRALIVGLSLALALTVGLLLRPDRPLPPGADYRVEATIADRLARVLEAEPGGEAKFVAVAARLRPSVVSIHGLVSFTDTSVGTGIILDECGHIITNLHVVDDLDEIFVTLSTGEFYAAEIIGEDEATDLAVIRIPVAEDLYPASWGDSDDLLVGSEVLAIGNAYGFGWTVSKGIISGVHRSRFEGRFYTDYVQTDAAINPGNSGGPLVDARGRVIGVNSVIVSRTGRDSGTNFALPSADVRFVADEIIRNGQVERGYLGLKGYALSSVKRKVRISHGIDSVRGILVSKVLYPSPAHREFRVGDVILEMADRKVSTFAELLARVARTRPGSDVEFRILRDGTRASLRVRIGRRPAS